MKTVKLYNFSELDEEAKYKALENVAKLYEAEAPIEKLIDDLAKELGFKISDTEISLCTGDLYVRVAGYPAEPESERGYKNCREDFQVAIQAGSYDEHPRFSVRVDAGCFGSEKDFPNREALSHSIAEALKARLISALFSGKETPAKYLKSIAMAMGEVFSESGKIVT